MKSIADTTTLHNGVGMPWLGLGVYKAEDGTEVKQAIAAALNVGYRSIDTAAFYDNEKGVGEAVREAGIPRDEIFVTTKVWNDDHGRAQTLRAFERSMELLGLEYLDLYLIHWPVPGQFLETWRALEELYRAGRVRAIGVSNFHVHHLQAVLENCEVKPMVNQVEYHPLLTQKPLLTYCQAHNIQLEAWSPLGRGRILTDPVVTAVAAKYDRTPAQILLRWDLQHGVVTIPKSVKAQRIAENAQIFDFALEQVDMDAIDGLNRDQRFGPDPDNFV